MKTNIVEDREDPQRRPWIYYLFSVPTIIVPCHVSCRGGGGVVVCVYFVRIGREFYSLHGSKSLGLNLYSPIPLLSPTSVSTKGPKTDPIWSSPPW